MKFTTRLSLCTPIFATDFPDTEKSPQNEAPTPTTLKVTLSLQTLPSVPSLQLHYSPSLSPFNDVTLSHSLSSSLSLSSPITSLSLHPTSPLLYVASTNGHVTVYDTSSPLSLPLLDTFNAAASSGSVKSLAFTSNGNKVLTAHQDGHIKIWTRRPHNTETRNKHKLDSTLPTLADRIRRYPIPNNHVPVRRHKKRLWVEHHDAVSCLAVVENHHGLLFSVSWDKTLKVWDPKKGFACMESVTAHDDAVNAVTVSPDGTIVYTGSADGRIRVWTNSKPGSSNRMAILSIATLEKHKSAVNALALSCDGSVLFSGACDRSILVWEREDTGKYMTVSGALRGHGGAILCLINVSDFLISGSADRTVRIWRRGCDGKFGCLAVLVGHLKAVKSLAGRMEGEDVISLFSGGLDGEIKVWKVKVNNSSFDGKSCR